MMTSSPAEHKGVKARIGQLGANPEAEGTAHGGAVVRGPELDIRVGPLRHVLPILIGDTDVVEPNAVWLPVLGQFLVEGHEVDAVFPDVPPDLSGVQIIRLLALRPVFPDAP